VPAELGLDGVADRADLQGRHARLELGDHHAGAEEAERPALCARAGVGRELGREGREVLARVEAGARGEGLLLRVHEMWDALHSVWGSALA
jgi:hypothetical protein